MSQPTPLVQPLLLQFQQLFFLSKLVGVLPQDLDKFRRKNVLEKSRNGMFYLIGVLIVYVILYNILIYSFGEEDRTLKASQSMFIIILNNRILFVKQVHLTFRYFDVCNWHFSYLYRPHYDGHGSAYCGDEPGATRRGI